MKRRERRPAPPRAAAVQASLRWLERAALPRATPSATVVARARREVQLDLFADCREHVR
jgi:hypothetical protein